MSARSFENTHPSFWGFWESLRAQLTRINFDFFCWIIQYWRWRKVGRYFYLCDVSRSNLPRNLFIDFYCSSTPGTNFFEKDVSVDSSMSVCLSVSMYACMPVADVCFLSLSSLSVCLSVCLSLCLSVSLFIFLSVYLSLCLFHFLSSSSLSVCMCACIYVCLSPSLFPLCLSVCFTFSLPPLCPFVSLSLPISVFFASSFSFGFLAYSFLSQNLLLFAAFGFFLSFFFLSFFLSVFLSFCLSVFLSFFRKFYSFAANLTFAKKH